MTVTSASRAPRRVAADSPPNPAPIITIRGREGVVEAGLSSAAATRSMIPSISSPRRRAGELRVRRRPNWLLSRVGHDAPGAAEGNHCEGDDDEAEPGDEA